MTKHDNKIINTATQTTEIEAVDVKIETANKAASPQNSTLVYDIRNSRYLNITGRCTLRCQFCPKHNGSKQVHQYELSLDKQVKPADIIPLLGNIKDFDEYVFCGYGEPTLNLDTLLVVADHIKKAGGKVRLNTDGLGNLFHRRNILPELASCIDSLSISLNANTEALYIEHCQPKLKNAYQAVLSFIEMAPHFFDDVQVSAINGLEGVDIESCQKIVEQRGAHFKCRQLDIVG
ncbi:TatD family nuclease-associated radical SAM protein [Shewanella donghaensis]|uniref:TatD family nuclease-associated radical SAM protein n=1 Tax=Shewanella donghaensis TaxID=238836 RepID=UPI0011843F4F|nr:TatD family nuclease-associated radical SAM protein [Shewanella donghaensis]